MLAMEDEEEKKGGAPLKPKTLAEKVAEQSIKNQIKRSVTKQDLDSHFEQRSFIDSKEKIINLSRKSGLRQINALEVARDLRSALKDKSSFNFEDFKDVVYTRIQRKVKSSISMQIYEVTLREIFNLFDGDGSNSVDSKELANCMAVMCGGSMSDKINAAFILFDDNNSGAMSFDELAALVKTVFSLMGHMIAIDQSRGKTYPADELFPSLDFASIAVETTKKAFSDLQVPITGELNYQQFVQWVTGMNLYSDEELAALQKTQPPTKSNFAKKQFNDANEWAKRFLQEEEFVDHLMKMREDCQLQNVSLVRA